MALQDFSLSGSGDSAVPQAPAQQNTQAPAAPQSSLPSAPVNPYIAQQQAAANDMNAAQAQIASQPAPTYTPPTLSGQPSYFARLLQGALNGLSGGLRSGQENLAGAGTPGFTPNGNGLGYAEQLQARQDAQRAEIEKQKQDTAQTQFENDKASYQMKQQQLLQQVQSAKNKMAVLDHLQSLDHADEDARTAQQTSMNAQLKEAQDNGARVTDLQVQPGQNPKDVMASFLQANPGWMADPNHNATVTYDGDGNIKTIHAYVDDSNRRVPVSEVNKRLAAIPGSTLQYDEGANPDQPHTMTVHDMNNVMASEHTTSAQRLYDAKKEQLKADQQMQLERYKEGQENYRHNTPAGGTGSIEGSSLANSTPDANGVRQQYLTSLPADVQAQVQAIGEGRMAPPNARTKIGKELADQVATAYPNYDASKQPAYQKMRNDFVAGKSGQGLNALNTAIEHLGVMSDNASLTSTLPGLSAIERGLGNQQANNSRLLNRLHPMRLVRRTRVVCCLSMRLKSGSRRLVAGLQHPQRPKQRLWSDC
jgi:hypothetical protein